KDRAGNAPWFSLSLGERVGVRAVAFSDLHWQPLFAHSCPLEIARNLPFQSAFTKSVFIITHTQTEIDRQNSRPFPIPNQSAPEWSIFMKSPASITRPTFYCSCNMGPGSSQKSEFRVLGCRKVILRH
ncbi:MAG: hypothetical protein L0Z50_03650, partial [Verrucomicrobiales bacterium]|nr:hypothetical protein [Verrucomicrobiales bacterium]